MLHSERHRALALQRLHTDLQPQINQLKQDIFGQRKLKGIMTSSTMLLCIIILKLTAM